MTANRCEAESILYCYADSDANNAADWFKKLRLHFGSAAAHVLIEARQSDGVVPDFSGRPSAGKLVRWARALADFDCVLTFGWGATNIALAHSVFGDSFKLPPLIHHEIGYPAYTAGEFTFRRNWFRRIALRSASRVIFETHSLAERAGRDCGIAAEKRSIVPPAFEPSVYDVTTTPDQIPGLIKREQELWLGTDASYAPAADLAVLVEVFAQMPRDWHLVFIGNVANREALQEAAERLELSHRLHFPGTIADRPEAYALLDAYIAPPCGMAFPSGTAKAMAAGQAVCATLGGESARLIAKENAVFLSASYIPAALGEALMKMAADPLGRAKAGQANRASANLLFGGDRNAAALSAAYGSVVAA